MYEKKKKESKEKGTPRDEVCDIEVWISADGAMSENAIANEAEMAELEELSKMPGTEVRRWHLRNFFVFVEFRLLIV